jgi:hypothetical protein
VKVYVVGVTDKINRSAAADGMECHKMRVAGALYTRRHGIYYGAVAFFERAVTAEHPNDVRALTVSFTKPFSIGKGVLLIENLRPFAPCPVELVAPCR